MPKIVFVNHDGSRAEVEAVPGASAMDASIAHGVPGIIAECGGSAACGTCHVYVESPELARLGALTDNEDNLLGFTAADRQPNSRLSCQIIMSADLDGMVLRIPDRQI
ncbi:MAG: 2Fe-2S iron-sulfur cluster-binding protein [Burkholderiaceae bacterium]|nr:2Fe-2S iron-sulfur cluster-binding protein [Burkholderiaceae bacterium]